MSEFKEWTNFKRRLYIDSMTEERKEERKLINH